MALPLSTVRATSAREGEVNLLDKRHQHTQLNCKPSVAPFTITSLVNVKTALRHVHMHNSGSSFAALSSHSHLCTPNILLTTSRLLANSLKKTLWWVGPWMAFPSTARSPTLKQNQKSWTCAMGGSSVGHIDTTYVYITTLAVVSSPSQSVHTAARAWLVASTACRMWSLDNLGPGHDWVAYLVRTTPSTTKLCCACIWILPIVYVLCTCSVSTFLNCASL
jgi:hypothetical protein